MNVSLFSPLFSLFHLASTGRREGRRNFDASPEASSSSSSIETPLRKSLSSLLPFPFLFSFSRWQLDTTLIICFSLSLLRLSKANRKGKKSKQRNLCRNINLIHRGFLSLSFSLVTLQQCRTMISGPLLFLLAASFSRLLLFGLPFKEPFSLSFLSLNGLQKLLEKDEEREGERGALGPPDGPSPPFLLSLLPAFFFRCNS